MKKMIAVILILAGVMGNLYADGKQARPPKAQYKHQKEQAEKERDKKNHAKKPPLDTRDLKGWLWGKWPHRRWEI